MNTFFLHYVTTTFMYTKSGLYTPFFLWLNLMIVSIKILSFIKHINLFIFLGEIHYIERILKPWKVERYLTRNCSEANKRDRNVFKVCNQERNLLCFYRSCREDHLHHQHVRIIIYFPFHFRWLPTISGEDYLFIFRRSNIICWYWDLNEL